MEQNNISAGYEDGVAEFLRELHRLQKNAHEQKQLLKCLQEDEKKLAKILETAAEEEFKTALQCAKAEANLLELRDSNKKLQFDFDKAKNDCMNFMFRQDKATKAYQKIFNSQCASEARRERLKEIIESTSLHQNPNLQKILRTTKILFNNVFIKHNICNIIKKEIGQVCHLCNLSIIQNSTFEEDSFCRLVKCFERFSETLSEEEQNVLKTLLGYK
ncbi:unnamed protein product [Phytomonas sp. Hart1]|nr:unnamed protein product [Phytomonas sp. Hart1]|eukprot:CCW66262.1 unnamed protein product [Phytomonas sp. isolate Hart1]